MIIELSSQGVNCDDAVEKLRRKRWSVTRFGKAALNGRDYYSWLAELAEAEVMLQDGSIQGILPIWQESDGAGKQEHDSNADPQFTELEEEARLEEYQAMLDFEVHDETIEPAAELVGRLDMSSYEALLPGVVTRKSPALTDDERLTYEEDAKGRQESLISIIAQNAGLGTNELDEDQVANLLVEFAQYVPVHHRARLAPDYRAMRAAMLWAYLQGAPAKKIERSAQEVNNSYVATLGSIRNAFLVFLGGKYHKEFKRTGVSRLKGTHQTNIPSETLLAKTARLSRQYEADALSGYRPRRPEIHGSVNERADICSRLTAVFGGNHGAYRRIFNLMAEVIVEDADMADVRKRIWGAVEVNAQQAPRTNSERLNNEEVKWLAPLCGKKLVPNPEKKRLEPFDTEPETVDDMRVRANYLYNTKRYGDQPPRTADDVEHILLEAFRKLLTSM
mgnify:CR=1 FL=1